MKTLSPLEINICQIMKTLSPLEINICQIIIELTLIMPNLKVFFLHFCICNVELYKRLSIFIRRAAALL